MSRKKKKSGKKSDVWKYKVTARFTAYERTDRGRQIWTRVGPNEHQDYENIRPLYGPIRDANGRIDPALETIVRGLAEERCRQMGAAVQPKNPDGPLTLQRAVTLVMDPKYGNYVGDTEWRRDVQRHFNKCIRILGDIPVDQIRQSHYRTLWRTLAEEHVAEGKHGVRAAEMACTSLRALMAWLGNEEKIDAGVGLPAKGWKAKMQEEWVKITGKPLGEPNRPRYTKEETERLWDALPKADPRIRLATQIGAEARLGQVIERTRRTDIRPHNGQEIGMVIIHGAGKKKGTEVVLKDEQRAVIVEALTTGYLRDVEQAFKAGKLEDYLLIPGGSLLGARKRIPDPNPTAQIANAMKAMGKRALRSYWRELEAMADVEHIDGRGWYGLRRRFADDAEDESKDGRVLRKIGGWTSEETRRRYQDASRTDIADEAANIREKIRPKKRPESGEITPLNSTTYDA